MVNKQEIKKIYNTNKKITKLIYKKKKMIRQLIFKNKKMKILNCIQTVLAMTFVF